MYFLFITLARKLLLILILNINQTPIYQQIIFNNKLRVTTQHPISVST